MSSFRSCALVTLDYPPERGGVARYLGNLVRTSGGKISTIYVPETHPCVGPGNVQAIRLLWNHWPRWAPMIPFFRKIGNDRSVHALISQVLPVGTAAWIASYFGGPRYSVLLHGLDLRLACTSKRKRWLLGRILFRAEAVFTNSRFVAKEIQQLFPVLNPVIVSPGVELQDFPTRTQARAICKIPDGVTQLLAVTRLVPRKGIDCLIESLALLPTTTHLTVIGGGADEARLRALAQPYGERVRFETHIEDEARNAWYAASDIFVLPTRDDGNDVEGFGIVFLEAALAGLPVVAGKGGGVEEAVLHEETGLLIDGQDLTSIADAVKRLTNDSVLASRLAAQGRARALRDFSWEDRWKLIAKTLGL